MDSFVRPLWQFVVRFDQRLPHGMLVDRTDDSTSYQRKVRVEETGGTGPQSGSDSANVSSPESRWSFSGRSNQ
jgi:hypothetical protein